MKRVMALVMGLMILLGGATARSSSSSSTQAATPASQNRVQRRYQHRFPVDSLMCERRHRKIPKTRLLADLALTYGAFQRYLYKPYKAGA